MMIDSDKLEKQITEYKEIQKERMAETDNPYFIEFLKGYICSFSVVEGMIAELKENTDADKLNREYIARSKVDKALSDIQVVRDSMKRNSIYHDKDLREHGENVAAGLQMALDILDKYI